MTTGTNNTAGESMMKNINFGVEIETVGRTRRQVANAIQSVVGGTVVHVGTPYCYDPYDVIATDGRRWRVMADSSLSADKAYQAEVVSPILNYGDIDTLQCVIRAVRATGARTDYSCGIHIHVDGAKFNPTAVRHLVKIVHKQEELIEHALGIAAAGRQRWCRQIDPTVLDRIENGRPRSMDDLNEAWYGYYNSAPQHYDETRYHGVNLHNLWFRGTVEFRWFAGTLHAGKVKAYIQFVLALSAKALTTRSSSSKRRTLDPSTAKYDFRVVLIHLGLIGDEFKTARLHLMSRLAGSSARKRG